ncbi:MAG: phosphate ABC transporter permease subunit PstC [Chloroflexota bacterium]
MAVATRKFTLKEFKYRLRHGDTIFDALTLIAGSLALLTVLAIGLQLWQESYFTRQAFGWELIFSADWNPSDEKFGALPFIYGTLQTSLVALLIALPLGLGISIFLAELASAWLGRIMGFLVELLAAVPSVIYGLWGVYVFAPTFVKPVGEFLHSVAGFFPLFAGSVSPQYSRLGASLILAVMILPTISAVSREVFQAIPRAQREAALALGATRWEMIWQVLIPYGLSGILGAVILGLGRALGETMAVTMVIGNNYNLTASLLEPGSTMSAIVAGQFGEAASIDLFRSALIEIGLILFAITLILNMFARLLVWRVARRVPTELRV